MRCFLIMLSKFIATLFAASLAGILGFRFVLIFLGQPNSEITCSMKFTYDERTYVCKGTLEQGSMVMIVDAKWVEYESTEVVHYLRVSAKRYFGPYRPFCAVVLRRPCWIRRFQSDERNRGNVESSADLGSPKTICIASSLLRRAAELTLEPSGAKRIKW